MLDTGSAEVRSGTRTAHLEIARRTALGMGIGVVVQYALGIWVNLYVTVPARDQGGGFFAAIGRALANGPVALGVHERRAGGGRAEQRQQEHRGCRDQGAVSGQHRRLTR